MYFGRAKLPTKVPSAISRVILGQLQRPAEDRPVDAVGAVLGRVHDPGEAAGAVRLRVVPDARQHRVEREGHEQRDQHRRRDHDAELEEETADDAAHEGNRQEYRDDAEGRRQHRQPDLVGAVDRGLAVCLAEADMAHDVLAHHDGIVDQDADGEAERHQRQHVQREAERRHHHEGAEHGDGKRQAGDHRAAPRVQEQEHDGDGEQAAFDHRLLDVADRVLDAARAVAHDLELDVGRHDGLKLGNGPAYATGDLDGVRTLRLDHIDGQRPLAVLGGDALEFLLAVDHGRDLPQVDRGEAAAGHDQVGEVPGLGDAAGDLDDAVVVAARDVAGGEILVLVPDCPHDVVDADPQRMHAAGVEFDVDLTLDAAGNGGAPDVAHGLQALDDELVGERRQVAHRTDVGAHGDRHDRLVVRIEALDQRFLDLRLEGGADLLDLLADVLHGDGRLNRELELGDDDRTALE